METDENPVQNLFDKCVNHLTNNNTIELNNCATIDDALTNNTLQNENGVDDSMHSQCVTDVEKSNFFELIASNENCDTETNDCNTKTILNNNDLAIGFVDDDDEQTNGDTENIQSITINQLNEAVKEFENNIGSYITNCFYFYD